MEETTKYSVEDKVNWLNEAVKADLVYTDTKYTCIRSGAMHADSVWVDKRYWYVSLASYGDYDDSCQVERANFKVLNERFDWIQDVGSGGYGHCAAGIWEEDLESIPDDDWMEFTEMVNSLSDYPSLDDEEVSRCEIEAEDRAWGFCYERDVRSDLVKALEAEQETNPITVDGNDLESAVDTIDGNTLFGYVREAMEATNTYWTHESGGNVYLDIKRIMPELVKLVRLHLLANALKGE